jgi:RNA polymerase sigma factor (sigma-70 family)
MQELDDIALLRQYTEQNSEEAFAALVTRHVNKVYSVALRHTHNPHQAEEITQAVFVIFAQKAKKLRQHALLSGWLYQTARLTAVSFIRSGIRRARREQEAHMQTYLNENESDVWPQISPLLDAAMAALNETDRHAVVLRFFDGKSMKEVGTALGASEDGAKMRLNRAVGKLRGFFTKRGIVLPLAVLTAAISANSVQAAPAMLAKTTTAVAIAKGATASTSTLTIINGALKIMAWTNTKTIVTTIGVAVILAASTTGVVGYKIVQTHRHTANWSMDADIEPDGTVYARATVELINTGNSTVTRKDAWTMTLSIDSQRLTDDDGQSIRFTQKPAQNGQFEYRCFLNQSVPPGKKFSAKWEGTVDGIDTGLIKSTGGPGAFEVQDDQQGHEYYTIHCTYNYRLPPEAVLLDNSPNLKEVTNGGRIEMRFDQVLPPRAKAAYHFRYSLPTQAN